MQGSVQIEFLAFAFVCVSEVFGFNLLKKYLENLSQLDLYISGSIVSGY